jgi:hypothetical protein
VCLRIWGKAGDFTVPTALTAGKLHRAVQPQIETFPQVRPTQPERGLRSGTAVIDVAGMLRLFLGSFNPMSSFLEREVSKTLASL